MATASCATCVGRPPSTWVQQWSSASPNCPCPTIRMPTMLLARSVCDRRFDRVHEHPGDVEAALLSDLLEARGAGDVDLGDVVADDVQPHEQQPAPRELRPEALGDLAVARGQRPGDAGAAGGEIGARLARTREPREAVRHGLAGDHQDALVAVADLRD